MSGESVFRTVLETWAHHFRLRMAEWKAGLERVEALLAERTWPPEEARSARACVEALRSSHSYCSSNVEQLATNR